MKKRYNSTREYYKIKYGERVLKICVDGGFTCPNRDGNKGFGGCTFCSERGSGDKLTQTTIQTQIANYFSSYKASRANKFVVYFQNFSGTYDNINSLREKYLASLQDDRIVGINIGTRPDCINDDIVKLLKEIKKTVNVTVELGLQTANENIGKEINRCYTNNDFTYAVNLLNDANIDVIAHIMVGLPQESYCDIQNTVAFINSHKLLGLKIHSTYIVQNTILAEQYRKQIYKPISLEYYIENLAYIVNHISPELILFRIVGDAPKDMLIAPEWNAHKKITLNAINNFFEKNDVYQGKFYTK